MVFSRKVNCIPIAVRGRMTHIVKTWRSKLLYRLCSLAKVHYLLLYFSLKIHICFRKFYRNYSLNYD